MARYIGYFRTSDGYAEEQSTRLRGTGEVWTAEVQKKIVEQFERLPENIEPIVVCTPLASAFAPHASHPGVWIAETDDPIHLDFINNLWAGILDFEWVPALTAGPTAEAATTMLEETVARR